ncbi:hypothetical protein [Moraxella bovis]|uniref:Uncharacterized protein n=1 Tax=Moraxella bovis TaxID=476 RepID=A0A1T0A0F2_MORBO|nr:hypothetical protein [Moraxella bovis]OOR89200.1 hypothetical protein B0182_07395 [Moraxella bovis]UZA15778.1 hypothetical protein LP109_08865 [Moraxella bovis]UZA25308.1 hypothetical protein LP117_02270 [Moraxella bovis]UZA29201.1 hypothetical protein LP097_09595 [Moraxella bovis]STY93176.1 Uncharacterised protein [Moraxella bovis]
MKVKTSLAFDEQLALLSHADRIKIALFIQQIQQHGLRGLQGRNKSSAPTNPHTKKERANFDYAQKHCLWHYHIGIPEYVGDDGDMTSECILHYQRFDDEIVLVDISTHPPFELPSQDKLKQLQ